MKINLVAQAGPKAVGWQTTVDVMTLSNTDGESGKGGVVMLLLAWSAWGWGRVRLKD